MRIFVVRCAKTGCFHYEWGFKYDWGRFLEMILDFGWYATCAEIGDVRISLYFCPRHELEGGIVNKVELQRQQAEDLYS